MTTLRTAAQQALEALLTYEQYIQPLTNVFGGPRVPEEGSASAKVDAAITALRAALAESVQEPVHEHEKWCASVTQLLLCDPPRKAPCNCKPTAPPQRKPLTEQEIWHTYKNLWMFHPAEEPRLAGDVLKFARAIERAHGIGDSNG